MTAREQRLAELAEARDRIDARIRVLNGATPPAPARQRKTDRARRSRQESAIFRYYTPRRTIYGDTPESQWANLVALDTEAKRLTKGRA